MTWTELSGAELRHRFHDDALARIVVEDDAIAVADDDSFAVAHRWLPGWDGLSISVRSDSERGSAAFAALADVLARRQVSVRRYSIDRALGDIELPVGWTAPQPDGGGRWEFMRAHTVVAARRDLDVIELDDTADAAEIDAFNQAHNPHSEGHPGQGHTSLWLAIRAGDELVAVGALQPLCSGEPYLAGLVVHADHRGRGYGTTVLAELAHRALRDHEEVALGVDARNERAIALYERMGFTHAHSLWTRELRAPWAATVPADATR